METAEVPDHLLTRTDMKVIGIAKDDSGAHGAEFVGGNGLDRGLGADGHENRRLHVTSTCVKNPGSRFAGGIGLEKGEGGRSVHRDKGDKRDEEEFKRRDRRGMASLVLF
jgi:hypothetical protein